MILRGVGRSKAVWCLAIMAQHFSEVCWRRNSRTLVHTCQKPYGYHDHDWKPMSFVKGLF